MSFQEIRPEDITDNPFKLIGSDWMLITAKSKDRVNMMTASWGGVGVMWNKPVAFVAIRPQRFTKTFVDTSEGLSLCFFDPKLYRKDLAYAGKASGRNEDKVAHCGFHVSLAGGIPYFDEAREVLICKKLFAQDYAPESFIDKDIIENSYPTRDFHTLYILEIEKVLRK